MSAPEESGMCGIFGLVGGKGEEALTRSALERMAAALRHRGPDDCGFHLRGPVGMGAVRLSILDLEGGHQPLSNEEGTVWAALDGEIYNFPALQKELRQRGHRFATRTDSEVLVHLYEEYGEECVHHLRGMFAFALWDERAQRLLLARDRLGIKPLHYFLAGERLLFASEIKALRQAGGVSDELNYEALDAYLTLEYIPGEGTIWREIRRLRPGHFLSWQRGRVTRRQYWDLREHFLPLPAAEGGESESAHRLVELLREAVEMRLQADVPLGVFLSGGLDSSTLVALASQVREEPVATFSLGFDEDSYNELAYARRVAEEFGTEHHEFVLTSQKAPEIVEAVAEGLDEPLADTSLLPTFLLSQRARPWVKAVLSGEGGDELFAGYETYLAQRLAAYYEHLPRLVREGLFFPLATRLPPRAQKKGWFNSLKRFVQGELLPRELRHCRWMMFLTPAGKERLYSDFLRRQVDIHSAEETLRAHFQAVAHLDELS
ncbi:MAG TPA: asparagine synthase (glutamine-hydrolyzing), partial [Armatimonadetes bacterium]|nr:asparagine synthase (glutamine-hydrolyzing) [Armatimonadota bacterium]